MARAGARPPRLASDAELVERARSGSDDAAFAELTRRHRAALVRSCSRVVGPDLAEDAAQQALLKALVALRSDGEPPAEIRAWLLRVARNEAIDAVRRQAREQGQGQEPELVAPGTPHDVLEERRELKAVVREIGRLPDRQREALLLRAIEGHGYEQIAQALDASEGMVRQLIYRARERVRAAAAAVIAPLWLLRRGLPAAHAAKVSAVVVTASVAVGGVAVIHHEDNVVVGAGPAEAHAAPAAPASKPPRETQVVLAGPPRQARHPRHHAAAHRPHHIAPKRRAARPSPAPKPRAATVVHHHSAPASPAPQPSPTPAPTHTPPATPTPPTPPATLATPAPPPPPTPTGPAAPAETGRIATYSQGPGFGGPLTIERSNGEQVTAYFGELVELSCYFVRDGHVASHDTCTKERLTAGTPVALAEHGPNANGNDVWTRVALILPAP